MTACSACCSATARPGCRLLRGTGVLSPLNDPGHFAEITVDPKAGTIVWPGGIYLAPEPLYEQAKAIASCRLTTWAGDALRRQSWDDCISARGMPCQEIAALSVILCNVPAAAPSSNTLNITVVGLMEAPLDSSTLDKPTDVFDRDPSGRI